MTLTLESPPLPLRLDGDDVIRVGKTRVTLATVVSAFKNGATAEQIAQDYSVLDLADIYAVVHFYLRRREQVDSYLAETRRRAEELRDRLESRHDVQGIRERLMARRRSK